MYIKGVRYIIILLLFSLPACNGYTYMSSVPAVPVQYVLNVLADDPTFVPANTGAYKIVKQKRFETDYIGYAGLLIYIGFDSQYHAFDLACPNCDRVDFRLTIGENGIVSCGKCGIKYDLNNDGVIFDKGKGTYESPRGLYRYPITYDGMRVNIIN